MNAPSKVKPAKLADDHGYRVAAEALQIATGIGVPDRVFEALCDLVQREAKRVQG
jgi:hypothetical protein